MFGEIRSLAQPSSLIVPVAFHVDYFNKPWEDRFSDKAYSQRQLAYHESYNSPKFQVDIYFTPMLMVDGRVPMNGSDRARARTAIAQALRESPDFRLEMAWGTPTTTKKDGKNERDLKVTVAPRSRDVLGKDLLVGVVVCEDPVVTKVEKGENAGKTLTEHFAARKFLFETIKFENPQSRTVNFSLIAAPEWNPKRLNVVGFVQDMAKGYVHQTETLAWTPETASTKPGA